MDDTAQADRRVFRDAARPSQCLVRARRAWLVSRRYVHPTPGAARTNDIPGDVIVRGKVMLDWGLHLIDVSLTLGNLMAVVGDESKSYLARSN